MGSLSNIDFIIIVIYFAVILGVGIYFSRFRGENRSHYFLAGRNTGWIAIGVSLFATNISSEHFVGLAGSGATRGLAVGSFEWMAAFWVILLAWIYVPVYLNSGIMTIPELLEKRFNLSSRMYLSTISIIAYILTKISVTLFAGGLLLKYVLGWDMYVSAVVMVVITGIYTIVGGLSAVIYTSVVQSVILIAGAFLLTLFGLNEIGGISALQANLPSDFFSMFKSAGDPDFPWTGILFGAPIIGIWYWCTDQYIVQRVLSAKNIQHARSGAILAGFLKILPVFLLVVPGLIAAVIFPGIKGDDAFPMLVASSVLPVGLKGIIVAGLLAALMSSLASCFNSTSTLFTIDFYQHFNPNASERKLVLVGRLATMFIVVTAILWVPLTKLISSNIYIYLQSIQAYISPPISALFIIGLFWKRINGNGATASLITGGIIGALRLVLEIVNHVHPIQNPLLHGMVTINFLHFAILLFFISAAVLVGVSFSTAPSRKPACRLPGVSGFLKSFELGGSYPVWRKTNVVFSLFLILIVVGLWSYFI